MNDFAGILFANTQNYLTKNNLLSNALKFTHEGHIEFGYILKGNELEFYVKDTGIGIEKKLHDKIFERFRQADLSEHRKYGGTGLGLAISKALAELLWAEKYGWNPNRTKERLFSLPFRTSLQMNLKKRWTCLWKRKNKPKYWWPKTKNLTTCTWKSC